MIVLAVVNAEDDWDNREILLGYEPVSDEFVGGMYLGLAIEEGKDDVIFAYVDSVDSIEDEIDLRWAGWDTFEYLPEEITEEEYWNGS